MFVKRQKYKFRLGIMNGLYRRQHIFTTPIVQLVAAYVTDVKLFRTEDFLCVQGASS